MNRREIAIGSLIFLSFSITAYFFILFNMVILNFASIAIGLISIPVSLYLFKDNLHIDFASSIPQIIILSLTFIGLIIVWEFIDPSWAVVIPYIFIVPVLIEEFNFRYLLQRLLLRKINPYSAVLMQALVYVVYYSKYVVADNGAGFPFPYNLSMILSVFGMGIAYGILSKLTKNFLLPTSVHLLVWALFPVMAQLSPGVASSLVPT